MEEEMKSFDIIAHVCTLPDVSPDFVRICIKFLHMQDAIDLTAQRRALECDAWELYGGIPTE
jgi:hypothetical protein